MMRRIRFSENRDTIKRIGIFSWSFIGLLLIAALFFYIIYLIRIAVIPLFIAMAIAYLVSPFMLLLNRKMRRGFAVTITYILFTAIVALIFFFIIPIIIDQFRVFIGKFPSYLLNLNDTIVIFFRDSIIVGSVEKLIGKEIAVPDMSSITQYFMGRFNFGGMNLLNQATLFTKSIINIVLYLVVGPLLGIYILKDIDKLRKVFISVLPRRFRNQAVNTMDRISRVAGRYIRGQILVSVIVGILCTVVLLVLKVDFPVLLGAIAGILNLIPLLGPLIGAIPAALAALFISPLTALLVILLFIAVQ
ncbi:MAG: AI-2E family transporter, partial [Actinobacteria bacterium]|nr:AI-2E family transporter [Actinomycetota bacterium]